MFTRIAFHYDPSGVRRAAPLVLAAADIRSAGFVLRTTRSRTRDDGEAPAVHIVRSIIGRDDDPYNDDGRPPTVWTTIVYPHVLFLGHVVEVAGFERPNLGVAGLARPAYEPCRPLDLPPDRLWDRDRVPPPDDFDEYPRQRVLLLP